MTGKKEEKESAFFSWMLSIPELGSCPHSESVLLKEGALPDFLLGFILEDAGEAHVL